MKENLRVNMTVFVVRNNQFRKYGNILLIIVGTIDLNRKL